MSFEELSARKQRILQVLIDRYTATAIPVSSKDIQEQYLPECSSATIRSEMKTLEEMGYLVKTHISSGRLPSPKAYKIYVDRLMQAVQLTESELDQLKNHFDSKYYGLEDIIKSTAKIISDVTNYTSIVVLDEASDLLVDSIKIVDLGANLALVIIVTESGIISDKTIIIPQDINSNYFNIANEMINRIFAGKTLREIYALREDLTLELNQFKDLFNNIIDLLSEYSRNPRVFLEGASKILEYPEYNNVGQVKQFMALIESKEQLRKLITDNGEIQVQMRIGKADSGIDNCSIVTAKYSIGGHELGQAGVIGPENMNYSKVLAVLDYVANTLNSFKNNKDDNTDKE